MDEEAFKNLLIICDHDFNYLTFLLKNPNLIFDNSYTHKCHVCRKIINNEQIRLQLLNKKFF